MKRERTEGVTTRRTLAALISLFASMVVLPLRAQETHDVREQDVQGAGNSTVIELGVEGDGTGASGGFASIGAPIGPNNTITAALGHTTFDDFEVRLPDGTTTLVEARPADRIALGFRHGFGDVGLNLGAERWGNNDLLEIDDYSAGFDFGTDHTGWYLDLIRRTADFNIENLPNGPRNGSLDAWGIDAGIDFLTEANDFYASVTYYDYGDELDAGPIAARLGAISPLSVADSLVKRGVLVGGEHLFNIWSFGMEASWYRSGIASVETKTLAAIFGLPISRRLDLNLTLGATESEESDTTGYGVLSLRCALGGEG
jgi:hypothetical protein